MTTVLVSALPLLPGPTLSAAHAGAGAWAGLCPGPNMLPGEGPSVSLQASLIRGRFKL